MPASLPILIEQTRQTTRIHLPHLRLPPRHDVIHRRLVIHTSRITPPQRTRKHKPAYPSRPRAPGYPVYQIARLHIAELTCPLPLAAQTLAFVQRPRPATALYQPVPEFQVNPLGIRTHMPPHPFPALPKYFCSSLRAVSFESPRASVPYRFCPSCAHARSHSYQSIFWAIPLSNHFFHLS